MANGLTPRIWIDTTAALTQRTGIARYVRELTRAMVALEPDGKHFGTYSYSWDEQPMPFEVPHAGSSVPARRWRITLPQGQSFQHKYPSDIDDLRKVTTTATALLYAPTTEAIAMIQNCNHPTN